MHGQMWYYAGLGALTVAELCAVGLGAILVPLPACCG